MKSETIIKHVFEADDFAGCGHYLVRSNRSEIKDDMYLSTIMFKIGWGSLPGTAQLYCLVAMSDGMCIFNDKDRLPFTSKQDLTDFINDDGSYRMATKDEVIRVVSYQSSRWVKELI
jgi:hypothetical protein